MIAAFRLLPLLWQLGIVLAGLAALGGGYALWHHKVYRSGYDAAIEDVKHENSEAINEALKYRGNRRACVDAGGVWSTQTGQCS